MSIIRNVVGRALVFAFLGILCGCAGSHDKPKPLTVDRLHQSSAAARSDCPAGKVKVCDRRKSVGCLCQSPRHMRALIGA